MEKGYIIHGQSAGVSRGFSSTKGTVSDEDYEGIKHRAAKANPTVSSERAKRASEIFRNRGNN